MQLKTKNGKCDINCHYHSAQTGCYAEWAVDGVPGSLCPGDMTVNEPTEQVPVILTDDGTIIFEEDTHYIDPKTNNTFVGQYADTSKKRGRKPNKN